MDDSRKEHWENVYAVKQPHEVSWTQEVPEMSLAMIRGFGVDKGAGIIDVGGGDSRLADCLLDEGYTNITVLDISANALERAKKRLGERAALVKWIVCDITTFTPPENYVVWHDRAAFHFLTTPADVASYRHAVALAEAQYLAIGTFSDKGPLKCSGLVIQQYTPERLQLAFDGYEQTSCTETTHTTPFNTTQEFLFCGFKRGTSPNPS